MNFRWLFGEGLICCRVTKEWIETLAVAHDDNLGIGGPD